MQVHHILSMLLVRDHLLDYTFQHEHHHDTFSLLMLLEMLDGPTTLLRLLMSMRHEFSEVLDHEVTSQNSWQMVHESQALLYLKVAHSLVSPTLTLFTSLT